MSYPSPIREGVYFAVAGLEDPTPPIGSVGSMLELRPVNPQPKFDTFFNTLENPLSCGPLIGCLDRVTHEIVMRLSWIEALGSDSVHALGLAGLRAVSHFQVVAFLTCSWSELEQNNDHSHWLMPCEVRQPLGLFKDVKGLAPARADWEWAIEHSSASAKLWREEPRYQTASMAFHDCQFIDHLPMCVALTWAGIEALFATQSGEATFRMAAYIAALLEPRGAKRIELHRRISKGYGTRSAIIHGRSRPSHYVLVQHLKETREILSRLLCHFVEMQKLPSQKALDELIHS